MDRQAAIGRMGTAIQRYQRSVQAFDDAVGRRLGLGPADLRCLDRLTEGPATAGELASATGLRPAATTALIDRLARRDLVRRTADDGDRRRVHVEFTEHGRALVDEAYGPLVVEGAVLYEHIGTDEMAAMAELLEAMTAFTDRHRERVAGSNGAPA